MDAAAVEALIKAHVEKERERHTEELARLRRSNEAVDQLARQTRIDQEKAKFRNYGDKRVIQFLLESKNDLEDFQIAVKEFEDSSSDLTESKSEFLKKWISFNTKSMRRINREVESYEIANNSKYGWLTEKLFRQNEVFDKKENSKAWYELPEPSASEKELKLKKAEKEAARISQEKEKERKLESGGKSSSRDPGPLPDSLAHRGARARGGGQARGGRGASGGVRTINIKTSYSK